MHDYETIKDLSRQKGGVELEAAAEKARETEQLRATGDPLFAASDAAGLHAPGDVRVMTPNIVIKHQK